MPLSEEGSVDGHLSERGSDDDNDDDDDNDELKALYCSCRGNVYERSWGIQELYLS